ncbi:MAG: DUF342 domain-containing protein [Sedimentisphaerales bacterium]|nr:DUF342 domain-containing protein [Sedimentisphaerales bacterium]
MSWQIEISTDGMVASLDLRQLNADDDINFESVMNALRERRIAIDEIVEGIVREFFQTFDSSGLYAEKIILTQGKPPIDPVEGYFEWSEHCDPEKLRLSMQDQEEENPANFYDQSNLIIVDKDDILGILHPAVEGQPGLDVFGQTIKARSLRDFTVKAGKHVEVLADGVTYVARSEGVPQMTGNLLSVEPTLYIKTDVDFNTGNINYHGDVYIKGDIKDLFEVKAEGNITVDGTIEAALVECQGSLTVKRGISGKEKGVIHVKKDLSAKYLSNVSAWVEGDAIIRSEIVNTDLNCRGRVILEKGAIHGGRVRAAGDIQAPTIGSSVGVPTEIRIAADPFLEREIEEIRALINSLTKVITDMVPRAKMILEALGGKPNDEVNNMAAVIKDSKQKIEQGQERLKQLEEQMAACHNSILVQRMLYPGVRLVAGSNKRVIDNETAGSMEITLRRMDDGKEEFCFQGARGKSDRDKDQKEQQ